MRGQSIYWRERGGVKRAYADLREYADVGGGREALVAAGEKLATGDPAIAQVLLARRLEELDGNRRGRALHGVARQATIAAFSAEHLKAKANSSAVTDDWLDAAQGYLERAVAFFGAERELASITVADVTRWVEQLQTLPNGRGGQLSAWTARHHLNALSNLFRRARAERVVPSGYDPVGDLIEKPRANREEARWLEAPDAALLLEAARRYTPVRDDVAVPFAYPLLATFLLTGGRTSEVLGLETSDVSFDRQTMAIRPNAWRGLKTRPSERTVPLWPQLEGILRAYVFGAGAPPGRLLFPSTRTGKEAMLTDFRKLLDAVAARAGWDAGAIRSKMFRHTYCAARLQTLDGGAPVSVYTVARELGHGSVAMVSRVYAHLGTVRHRAKVVEYRVAQHRKVLGDRLRALEASGFGTTIGTARRSHVTPRRPSAEVTAEGAST